MKKIISLIHRLYEPVYFYTLLAVYYFFSVTELTMFTKIAAFSKISKLSRYLIYIYWIGCILDHVIQKYDLMNKSWKERICWLLEFVSTHLILTGFGLLSILILFSNHSTFPIVLVLLLWSINYYDLKKIIRIYFGIGLLTMVLAWLGQLQGILPEVLIFRSVDLRYSFGYIYPLEFMTHFLFLVITYVYIEGKKIANKDLLMIVILALAIFKLTDARSSFILTILVVLLAFMNKYIQLDWLVRKIPTVLYLLGVSACFIVPIVISIRFNGADPTMAKIDTALSNRLMYSYRAIQNYGFSLFGKNIHWIGSGGSTNYQALKDVYNFVDCAYLKILLDFGVVFYVFLAFATLATTYRIINSGKDNFLTIGLYLIVLIISLLEPRLLSISINPFILLYKDVLLYRNPLIKRK